VVVVYVPITFFIEAGGVLAVSIGARLCVEDREVAFALIPTAAVVARAGASISLIFIEAGIGIEATILEITLVPLLSIQLVDGGAIRVCLSMTLYINPLKLAFYAFARLRVCFSIMWVDVGFVQLPIPILDW
jgi:hypothetical protein